MLAKEDITQIEALIEQVISRRPESRNANVRYELDLRERTVRVEEELKHQRELMIQGFESMDKRFEQAEKRFEQIDKRFEQVERQLAQSREEANKRFEQIDKRFEQMDKRFEEMGRRLDRFMFWSLGLTVSTGLFIVNYLK